MTKKEAKVELINSNIKLGDIYTLRINNKKYVVDLMNAQVNTNNTNLYHPRIRVKEINGTSEFSEELSVFHKRFEKLIS
jgi:hypothetical protein